MNVNACQSDLRQPVNRASSGLPRGVLWRSAIALFRFLQEMIRGIAERRMLDALSHHSLQDIGLTRFEIDYEMGKAIRRD